MERVDALMSARDSHRELASIEGNAVWGRHIQAVLDDLDSASSTNAEGYAINVELRADRDRLRGLLDDALDIIEGLTVTDAAVPCSFDHHGDCQAHNSTGEPGGCVIRDGYEFVRNVREAP